MKHLILICAIVLGTSCCAKRANAQPTETATGEHEVKTVVGCLSKNGHIYNLTGGSNGPKEFRIVSNDTSWLNREVGHTIKVIGTVSQNNASANQNETYNAGSTTGVGYLIIYAQKMTEIYANCSDPGAGSGGNDK